MRIRDDIDPSNTWIISDTHFGHDNIVGFCFRPEDHEQVMIAQWRAAVPDDATVLHLGDVCYGHNGGNTRFRRLTSKELTGRRKLLVRGNHDNQTAKFYRDAGFKLAMPFAIEYADSSGKALMDCPKCYGAGWVGGVFGEECRDCGGQQFIPAKWTVSFSHYAWNAEEEGRMGERDIRVHGHIHNNGYTRDGFVPFLRNHINVSVEQLRYTPVRLDLLLDAALLGSYPQTTPEQIEDARSRRAAAMGKEAA